MRVKRQTGEWALLVIAVVAMGMLAGAAPETSPRLVSVQPLPEDMAACTWEQSTGANPNLIASLQQENLFSSLEQDTSATLMAALQRGQVQQAVAGQRPQAPTEGGGSFELPTTERQLAETAALRAAGARMPVRTIRDTAPAYSAVAVDVNSNEVILQDNNLWSYRVFDRMSPTPTGETETTKAKRIVTGDKTALQFNNGLYVDPVTGDIFSVESDTGDKMVRFSRDANGNVPPKAILHTPHRVYNIAADETKQELYVTVEFPPEVVVYPKDAKNEDQPTRRIAGDNTGLDAPHGIAVDEKNRLLFVNTWGHHSNFRVQGTGRYFPPAIKVYSLDALGDAKPLRVITGDKTQLNWPAAMKFNPDNGDLYVANDIGRSVLVFANASNAQGDVAPVRVIKGPSTKLRNPTGIAIDRKNQEVWVSNLGNSTATVYPLMANGDVAPLRIIRSAEESKRGVNFGRTAAVTYDPVRQEILVPNWVNHPQIAIFARSAKEDTPYLRSIEGQKSLLGRTMHDIAFDAIHDEIAVTSPLAQAILSFRGAANGEEAPLRVIQGNRTLIKGVGATGKVSIDPVHDEIFLATPDQQILVFNRTDNGNVAPKRILGGNDTQLSLGEQNTGGGNVPCIRIDPIHNLLLVPVSGRQGGGRVLVFDRAASGNTKPKAVIRGPVGMGNQFEVYAPKQRLVTHTRNHIEIWKIPDSGESTEQPIRIPAPLGRQSGDIGIVLDPIHKEVIVASAAGNNIQTFSVPEVFD